MTTPSPGRGLGAPRARLGRGSVAWQRGGAAACPGLGLAPYADPQVRLCRLPAPPELQTYRDTVCVHCRCARVTN